MVQTLLTVGSRLSQCELANRANVSTRTIRNYRDRLWTFGLIRVDQSGHRLALSFQALPTVTTLLFRLSSRRTRRSSTQPMHCSGRFSHQIATAIPTIYLGVRCFGH
ncbi:hypothetical protein QA609_18580 [Natronococcus sp. A-GB7]|nr:hypothetical protein [Natronococcus sp. A-GB7]MDG5820808.1 hypothetical protein [Natronococcus sp. A-GB7]